jgi:hypothetical protein
MNKRLRNSGGVRGVVALLLSLSVASIPLFSRTVHSARAKQNNGVRELIRISSVTATRSTQGAIVKWRTAFEVDNVGFNVYREVRGKRVKVNREIVPGSMFIVGEKVPLPAGYSYSIRDPGATGDSLYSIEAMALDGTITNSGKIAPRWMSQNVATEVSKPDVPTTPSFEKSYPRGETPVLPEGQIEDQWAIAAQPGLKISITKDGWYRVTQQQSVAAGFNPTVDIRNLRLFNNGRELAILTNRPGGQFSSGDYIEFYGEAIDTPTSGTNTYYLIAGATAGRRIPTPGKRERGGVRSDSSTPTASSTLPIESTVPSPPSSTKSVLPLVELNPQTLFWWLPPVVPTRIERPLSYYIEKAPPARARPANKRSRKAKKNRTGQVKLAHAIMTPPGDAITFDNTVQLKERSVYFSSLTNGDIENFFGAVLSSIPVDQKLTTQNPATSGTAHLEIVLQGASSGNHLVNVELNGSAIGAISLHDFENKTQLFNVPVSQLLSGLCMPPNQNCNNVRLTPSPGMGLSIVDLIRITYPHNFRADDTGSLRFSLGPSESATIDGFNTPGIRVIEYTDPLSVRIAHAVGETGAVGYSIRVPTETGPVRTRKLLAIPESSFGQPAALSLNNPSTLNLGTNGADIVIIAHSTLLSSMEPLRALRSSQQFAVSVLDVEDSYDEFSYGVHGPQAIKDFLSWAASHWTIAPRYVIFAGDASYDPRDYLGYGNRDFVPTKLVDATFNETSSDEWFTDFDNDGVGEIPVGRLPVSSVAQANIVISKIVNFSPANVPQSALLVADTQGTYYYNFEQANTEVQALLPAGMTVQRVDRRLQPSDAVASANIIANMNSGQALVNYSGHGNVDTWTDASIFTTDNAEVLNNGVKLPLVVVMDCLNGYFQEPSPTFSGLAEAFLQAPNGGAVASFASSGLTIPDGQHVMNLQLYTLLYGSQPIALGDAIKISKAATSDIDVRRTWIFFGDPSMRIR